MDDICYRTSKKHTTSGLAGLTRGWLERNESTRPFSHYANTCTRDTIDLTIFFASTTPSVGRGLRRRFRLELFGFAQHPHGIIYPSPNYTLHTGRPPHTPPTTTLSVSDTVRDGNKHDDMLTPTGYPPPARQQPTRPTAHTAHSQHCGHTGAL